jgi:hypothetical protein
MVGKIVAFATPMTELIPGEKRREEYALIGPTRAFGFSFGMELSFAVFPSGVHQEAIEI